MNRWGGIERAGVCVCVLNASTPRLESLIKRASHTCY